MHSALDELTLRLNALVGTAVDGIITIDEHGIIESTNPAAEALFGYREGELIGEKINRLMPRKYSEHHDGYMRNYIETGQKKVIGIGREVEGLRKDGTEFPFRLSLSEIIVNGRRIFTGIIHDISELKEAQEEIMRMNEELEKRVIERTDSLSDVVNRLIQANHKLEREIEQKKKIEETLRKQELEIRKALEKERELSELKSRFVSMASHEFRTPLSTILSSASLISKYTQEGQQEQRNKHIERIKSAVQNLTNILDDFLSLSKLEEGIVDNTPQETNLDEFFQDFIDEVEHILKPGQKIQYHCNIVGLVIMIDRFLMKNILYNLTSNGSKYSGEDSIIDIYCKYNNNLLEIAVHDQGIGIPVADQKHLFERFFRASNATNIPGTGLGLNIMKRYVDLLNGSISFVSRDGQGTTFTVVIPLEL